MRARLHLGTFRPFVASPAISREDRIVAALAADILILNRRHDIYSLDEALVRRGWSPRELALHSEKATRIAITQIKRENGWHGPKYATIKGAIRVHDPRPGGTINIPALKCFALALACAAVVIAVAKMMM